MQRNLILQRAAETCESVRVYLGGGMHGDDGLLSGIIECREDLKRLAKSIPSRAIAYLHETNFSRAGGDDTNTLIGELQWLNEFLRNIDRIDIDWTTEVESTVGSEAPEAFRAALKLELKDLWVEVESLPVNCEVGGFIMEAIASADVFLNDYCSTCGSDAMFETRIWRKTAHIAAVAMYS